MNWMSWIVTILGLIATIIGSYLAIITYISPIKRVKYYLKRTKKWKKINISRDESNWQYETHPEFVIEIDEVGHNWTTKEGWMKDYPDETKHVRAVKIKVNGQALVSVEFISLDGGRYFIPVPERKLISGQSEKANFSYWYTPIQVGIANIIGRYYRDETLEKFMNRHSLTVQW
ncbi:MAG: hypothetical protein PHY34_01930 [Patescibacteria group bacterium]|nr:hypothetical protein [Patescibacteria group bacterium]MDD5715306.1 hypothetical protein [Patescibacteria group bacterium]